MINFTDLEGIKAKSITSRTYITLSYDSTIQEALSIYQDSKASSNIILVADSEPGQVEIITPQLILQQLSDRSDLDLPLARLALKRIETVDEDTLLVELWDRKGFDSFPVATVDSRNRVTGIISVKDILNLLHRNLINILRELSRITPVVKALELYVKDLEGIAITDKEGLVLFANKLFSSFFNTTRRQIINRRISSVVDKEKIESALSTGLPQFYQEKGHGGTDKVINLCPVLDGENVIGALVFILSRGEFRKMKGMVQHVEILQGKIESFQKELITPAPTKYDLDNIIGASEEIRHLKKMALKAAKSSSPVLILGETGVGKEMFAHAVHHASPRRSKPFIKINCAAIPKDLLEAELFGYEAGAFTGAGRRGKPGKFELAHEGTIFLDEIGEMPLEMQPKLLRALEEKEIERIGGIAPIRVNFRLITASNAKIVSLIKEGKFREDLYYRVNVLQICIPPLRERKRDIPLLAEYFLHELSKEQKWLERQMTEEAMNLMMNEYSWPGNIRELRNVLERVTNWVEGETINESDIEPFLKETIDGEFSAASDHFKKAAIKAEREALVQLLESVNGDVRKAAETIGVHRTTLYKKLKKLNLGSRKNVSTHSV